MMNRIFAVKSVVRLVLYSAMWLLVAVVHYRSGGHYLPIGVEAQSPSGRIAAAWVISPFGGVRQLSENPHRPGVFYMKDDFYGPVQQIAVDGPADVRPRIKLGQSYIGLTSTIVRMSEVTPGTPSPTGLPAKARLFAPELRSSLLSTTAGRTINWDGDLNFVCVTLLQSLFMIVVFEICLMCSCSLRGHETACPGISGQSVCGAVFGLIAVSALLILGHQLSALFWRLAGGINSTEQSIALLLLLIGAFVLTHFAGATQSPAKTGSGSLWLILIVGVFVVLKIVVSGALPLYQTGDYALYHRMGQQILDGEWRQANSGTVFDPIYIERSMMYGTPAAIFERLLPHGDILLHYLVTGITTLLLYRTIYRSSGRKAAVIAALGLNLYPDVLFGSHLCRHENPFLLYLVVFGLLISRLSSAISAVAGREAGAIRLILYTVGTGILCAILELQRRHGIFAAAAVALSVTLLPQLRTEGIAASCRFRRLATGWAVAILSFVVSLQVSANVRSYIDLRCGGLNHTEVKDWLCASETATSSTGADMWIWLTHYVPGIPAQERSAFNLRKLAYEKLSSERALLGHILRKNGHLGDVLCAVRMSGGIQQYEHWPVLYFNPFVSMKICWARAFSILLAGLAITRLLHLRCLPMHCIEFIWWIYGLVLVVAILLFGEAEEQYDICLALPMAVSAARLLCSLSAGRVGNAAGRIAGMINARNHPLFSGAVLLCCLIAMFSAVAFLAGGLNRLQFVAPVEAVTVSAGDTGFFERNSLCLRAEGAANSTVASSIGTSFRRRDFAEGRLRCLLTRDYRRGGQIPSGGDNAAVCFRCLVNGALVAEGQLAELETARWLDVALPNSADDVHFALELLPEGESADSATQIEVIAAEYFH